MYPSFATLRPLVRAKLKKQYGDDMKVRFTNRNGRLYCTVIDKSNQAYDNRLMQATKACLEEFHAVSVSLTSAGGGHYTYHFEMEDFRS